MKKVLATLSVLAMVVAGYGATHVFWYKATTNGYNLTQESPGPGIPAGATVYEDIIMTAGVRQSAGDAATGFFLGNGLDNAQGRCGMVWSKKLCELSFEGNMVTSAKFRGEYRDGWAGNGFCNAGNITFRCGVADFQGNIDVWGTAADVSESATWQDFLNPLGSSMGYDMSNPTLEAEENISFAAPQARPSESDPSVLDGQFAELDITTQVNWIVAHTGANKGSYSGQYAIVFLVAPGPGSPGKINLYSSEEQPGLGMGSDNPWTTDANTAHILIEGTVAVEKGVLKGSASGLSLSSLPNPFTASTNIAYNTGDKAGKMTIYASDGKLVYASELKGAGSVSWNAADFTSGIYLARLTAGNRTLSTRLILAR